MLVECVLCRAAYNPKLHNGHCPRESTHPQPQTPEQLRARCANCDHTWGQHSAFYPHECMAVECGCKVFVAKSEPIPGSFDEFVDNFNTAFEKHLGDRRVTGAEAAQIVNEAYKQIMRRGRLQ